MEDKPAKLSDRDKIEIYEHFLHMIDLYVMTCSNDKLGQLIKNASNWSYAHRVGNGGYSNEEQDEIVNKALLKLCRVE